MRNYLKRSVALRKMYAYLLGFNSLSMSFLTKNKTFLDKRECTYFDDGFATTHFVGFQHDKKFNSAFDRAFDGVPRHLDNPLKNIQWRAHICTWAANQAYKLGGDFVECGVWYGILSRTICNYVDFKNYPGTFFLIDSWGEIPGSHHGYRDDIFAVVTKRFDDLDNVKLVRGLVPEVLGQVQSKRIAFLSIDMNGSIAERAALEYFYDKMLPGGVIYFDDYGWDYPELRATVDDFFADKPEKLLHFPSGNSIAIKI
jgi:O-methyltransferase